MKSGFKGECVSNPASAAHGIALAADDLRKDVFLSIIIPSYNEQQRLANTLTETLNWCKSNETNNWEILVVDDGSSDDMLEVYRGLEQLDPRVRVLLCPHLGKGAAVRMGMLNARGEYVLFMDADGATPLTEISKLVSALDSGHQVADTERLRECAECIYRPLRLFTAFAP